MKTKFFALLLIVTLIPARYCSAQWLWANHLGSSYVQFNENAQIINDGTNSYLIGSFGGVLYLPNDTLIPNGYNDIFIAKFDANGSELWSKNIGGYNPNFYEWENARGLYDSICNCIYITGQFSGGAATFGSAGTLFSSGGVDAFIAKMDLNGNFIWANKIGGPGFDFTRLYSGMNNNLYLISHTTDSCNFGGFHLPGGGSISRFDTNGVCTMAKNYYSFPNSNSNQISLGFIKNDLLIHGYFNSNPFLIDTTHIQNKGNYDALLARADSNGNIKWIRSFGNSGLDAFQSIAVDDSNYIYVSGVFNDSIDLGGIKLYNNGPDNLYAKFDENGNSIWARQTHATGNLQGASQILYDKNGNCYFTGIFSGTANFGGNIVSTSNQTDAFLTRYSSNGDCLGVLNFGQAFTPNIALDNQGYLYAAGEFSNTINFGTTAMSSIGGYDLYIAKHSAITGIKNNSKSSNTQLLFQPNPTDGKCDMIVPNDFLHEQNLMLSIYNSNGKLIQQKNIERSESSIKINIADQAKGLYYVVLRKGTKSYSGKIVFE